MESLEVENPIDELVHFGQLTFQVVGQYIHHFRIPNFASSYDAEEISKKNKL